MLRHFASEGDIPEWVLQKALAMAEKRNGGFPLQYLLGRWDFRNIELELPKQVLIPRPETEELVDILLDRLPGKAELRGFEMGVGSGAISLSILSERNNIEIYANDISMDALFSARQNAHRLELSDRFYPFCGSCLEALSGKWDFIIANPPYVDTAMYDELEKELSFEPHDALFSNSGGMALAKNIILSAKNSDLTVMEIAEYNSHELLDFAITNGFRAELKNDLSGKPIFIILT